MLNPDDSEGAAALATEVASGKGTIDLVLINTVYFLDVHAYSCPGFAARVGSR